MRQVPRSLPLQLQGVSHDDGDASRSGLSSHRGAAAARRADRAGRSRTSASSSTEVDRDLLHHRIITDNAYTRWFRDGQATDAELAPLRPAVLGLLEPVPGRRPAAGDQRPDAPAGAGGQGDPDERAGRDLPTDRRQDAAARADRGRRGRRTARATPSWSAPRGRSTAALFRFRAAHFEWLLAVGEGLGLGFDDLGKRRHGRPTPSTSATSSSGSTAARTTRSPRGRASPSRTGPPPASGRSSKTA